MSVLIPAALTEVPDPEIWSHLGSIESIRLVGAPRAYADFFVVAGARLLCMLACADSWLMDQHRAYCQHWSHVRSRFKFHLLSFCCYTISIHKLLPDTRFRTIGLLVSP